MQSKWFIIFVLIYFSNLEVQAQYVVITNQNDIPIESEISLRVTLNYDNDTIIKLNLKDSQLYIDTNLCKSIVDLEIDPVFGQVYKNQFLCSQLKSIDTIIINQTMMIKGQTPRLLLGLERNLDSIFVDQLWMGEWLKEYKDVADGISFWVNNSDSLNSSDKKRITEVIQKYCSQIGREEFAKKIEYKNEPYTTGQEDFFNDGTVISREFIENQNTNFMKNIAEKYSLVVVVVINWNRN